MKWDGGFTFGDVWAAYRGPAADNATHAHAALQLVFGLNDDIVLGSNKGEEFQGRGFLIRPATPHVIISRCEVGSIYFQVQAPLAQSLGDLMGPASIASLPDALLDLLDPAARPQMWLESIQSMFPCAGRTLDTRVADVLDDLIQRPPLSIANAAHRAGVSESRLRELARAQLGVSLSTWLVWRKLERAAKEIAAGAGLADAAVAAGFADQAHCARAMRRMFGVTPGMARNALN